MTNAEAVIRSTILEALTKSPKLASIIVTNSADTPEIVTNILESLFAPGIRSYVKCYAEELNIKSTLELRARRKEYEEKRRKYALTLELEE